MGHFLAPVPDAATKVGMCTVYCARPLIMAEHHQGCLVCSLGLRQLQGATLEALAGLAIVDSGVLQVSKPVFHAGSGTAHSAVLEPGVV